MLVQEISNFLEKINFVYSSPITTVNHNNKNACAEMISIRIHYISAHPLPIPRSITELVVVACDLQKASVFSGYMVVVDWLRNKTFQIVNHKSSDVSSLSTRIFSITDHSSRNSQRKQRPNPPFKGMFRNPNSPLLTR